MQLSIARVAALAGGGLLIQGWRTHRRRVRAAEAASRPMQRSLTIGKAPEVLHSLWRNPETLRVLMAHFADVTPLDADTTRWTVKGLLGRTLSWDSRIVEDVPGERLRWTSLPGAALPHEGSLTFHPAPADWGTVATLRMHFRPKVGRIAELVQRFETVPGLIALRSLRRLKALAEAGEIPTTEKNPSTRRSAPADARS